MTSFRNMTGALIALSMVTAPVAAQAQTAATTSASSSWGGVVMSYISTLCAQQASGCILPLPNAAPPPPPAPTPTVAPPPPPPPPPAPAASGGFPFLPLLLGLGAIAGGVLLLDGGDDDDPISA